MEDQKNLLLEKAKDLVAEHLVLGTYQDDIKKELRRVYGLTYSLTRKGNGLIKLYIHDPISKTGKIFFI